MNEILFPIIPTYLSIFQNLYAFTPLKTQAPYLHHPTIPPTYLPNFIPPTPILPSEYIPRSNPNPIPLCAAPAQKPQMAYTHHTAYANTHPSPSSILTRSSALRGLSQKSGSGRFGCRLGSRGCTTGGTEGLLVIMNWSGEREGGEERREEFGGLGSVCGLAVSRSEERIDGK